MAGNESIIMQGLQYMAIPVVYFFYIFGGAFVALVAYEVFDRWQKRKEESEFHREFIELHKIRALERTIEKQEDADTEREELKRKERLDKDVSDKIDQLLRLLQSQKS